MRIRSICKLIFMYLGGLIAPLGFKVPAMIQPDKTAGRRVLQKFEQRVASYSEWIFGR